MKKDCSGSGIDRRSFLQGAAVSAAALAAVSLPGCASNDGSQTSNGDAAENAGTNNYQLASDWLGKAPEIAQGDITETFEGDIIVVGGGNAGIQAALAAAEGGAKVHVLELSPQNYRKVKGQDVGHVNSQWLIDKGFGPYDEGEIVQEFLTRCGGRNNPEIIKRFVLNSGEAFDHMISLVTWPDERIKLMPFSPADISPLDPSQLVIHEAGAKLDGPVSYPIAQGGYKTWASTAQFIGSIQHNPQEDGREGTPSETSRLDEVQQFSILKSEELGAEWHYEMRGRVLTTDESGAVTGVLAENSDGSYTQYKASKGVILCAGDFGGNVDMSWALLGEISEWASRANQDKEAIHAYSTCEGDGHKMACWAGALVEPLPRPTMAFFMSGGGPWGTAPYLWLNKNGKRYMNEAATQLTWPVNLRQPEGALYTFTDAKWFNILKMTGVDHGAPNCAHTEYFTELKEDVEAIPLGSKEGGPCRNCTQTGRAYSKVFAAHTLDELCDLLGLEGEAKDTALASIEHYNELCRKGKDSDFNKDDYLMLPIDEGPFYGTIGSNKKWDWVGLVSLAGVLTDDYLQVLNASGEAIPGLWAAGNCLGGRYGNGYATPMAGNSIGMAITHGRVAGKVATGQAVL